MRIEQIFDSQEMIMGRMISVSKSRYREMYPDNTVYFNANIFTLSDGKIWWGDIDLTLDREKLKLIASELGEDLFILREMDGRFENEELSQGEIISRAVSKIGK